MSRDVPLARNARRVDFSDLPVVAAASAAPSGRVRYVTEMSRKRNTNDFRAAAAVAQIIGILMHFFLF